MLRNYGTLTDRQVAMIQAIRSIQARDGIPPSQQDIAEEMGVTIGTVRHFIKMGLRKGLITTQVGKYRSIRLTAAASTVPEPKKKRVTR